MHTGEGVLLYSGVNFVEHQVPYASNQKRGRIRGLPEQTSKPRVSGLYFNPAMIIFCFRFSEYSQATTPKMETPTQEPGRLRSFHPPN